jgi:hypothetical protein
VGVTDLQQVFDFVLEEMKHGDVTESRRDIGYNKPYDMVRATTLTVGAQRLLNAVNFIASHNPDQAAYDIDLARVKWLANISTRDYDWIDGIAKELQQAAIEVIDPDSRHRGKEEWVRMPLLGPAGVKHGRFAFELNSVHRRVLRSPHRYAFFSLTKGHKLSGDNAPVLHDRLLQDVFRGHTDWIEIPEFLGWFGKAESAYFKKEGFRAIRSSIIEPSLAEINEKAEFSASWEPRNRGRKVIAIRFNMVKKAAGAVGRDISEVRSQLYDVLRAEFNLNTHDLDAITANSEAWTEDRLLEVIELTRYRIEHGKKEVGSPRALFMHLLNHDAVFTPLERERAEKARKAKAQKDRAEKTSKNLLSESASKAGSTVDAVLGRFANLNETQQNILLERFQESPTFGAAKMLMKPTGDFTLTAVRVLEDAKLRGLFSAFLERALENLAPSSGSPA